MVISKQPTVPAKISYKIITLKTTQYSTIPNKIALLMTALLGCLLLTACQITPLAPATTSTATPNSSVIVTAGPIAERTVIVTNTDELDDELDGDSFLIDEYANDEYSDANIATDYSIEPYIPPNQITSTPSYPTQTIPDDVNTESVYEQVSQPSIKPNNSASSNRDAHNPQLPSRNELLERARQNSQQQTRQTASDSSSLPAFRNLMQAGTNQLKSEQLTAAESSFTRAQRLAPKSSAVYFYLAQVALKKNQPRKAEAMARRGLVVSKDASRRRALWQIILQSGQAQNNTRLINEAKQALR